MFTDLGDSTDCGEPTLRRVTLSSFNLIAPQKALDMIAAAGFGDDPAKVIADYAAGGIIKGHARLLEITASGQQRRDVRDQIISRDVWRRIIDEDKTGKIAAARAIRLAGSSVRGVPEIDITGIRFDERSVAAVVAQHGSNPHKPGESGPAVPVAHAVLRPTVPPVAEAATALTEPDSKAKPRVIYDAAAPAYSVKEAAAILGVCRATVNNHMRRGTLPWSKVGGRTLVGGEGLRALIPTALVK